MILIIMTSTDNNTCYSDEDGHEDKSDGKQTTGRAQSKIKIEKKDIVDIVDQKDKLIDTIPKTGRCVA